MYEINYYDLDGKVQIEKHDDISRLMRRFFELFRIDCKPMASEVMTDGTTNKIASFCDVELAYELRAIGKGKPVT